MCIFESLFKKKKKPFQKDIRILFVLKYREKGCEWGETGYTNNSGLLSSGLFNSASFVNDYLVDHGVESKIVHVIDNNYIDREVTLYKPTHVIIEAYWVVPEKFDILTKLHPNVKWIIRNHSHTPFLANEGIAYDWTLKYLEKPNVYVSCNYPKAYRDMQQLALSKFSKEVVREKIIYQPNLYRFDPFAYFPNYLKPGSTLKVGIFGAIRPLKNQLSQVLAALRFARENGYKLEVHINGTRQEGKGEPVLKNIRALFDHVKDAKLVEHNWLDHDKFLDLICDMHICLQVTYTETFNIVAADTVSQMVPIVVSSEIDWVSSDCYADPNDTSSIVERMYHVLDKRKEFNLCRKNYKLLQKRVEENAEYWKTWP